MIGREAPADWDLARDKPWTAHEQVHSRKLFRTACGPAASEYHNESGNGEKQ